MSLIVGKSNVAAHVDIYTNSQAFQQRPAAGRDRDVVAFREMQTIADDIVRLESNLLKANEDTHKGLKKKIGDAIRASKAAMQPHDAEVTARQQRRAEIRAKATATPMGTRDLDTVLMEREIRDRLASRDPLEVNVVYLSALEKEDWLTVRAIENSPPTFPLLNAQQREVGNARKLLKSALVDDVMEADAGYSAYRTIAQAVHSELAGLAERYGVKDTEA